MAIKDTPAGERNTPRVEGQIHGMEEELKTKEEQGTKAEQVGQVAWAGQAGQVARAAQAGLKFTPAMLETNMAEQMTNTADQP